jgi:hypothetical protein
VAKTPDALSHHIDANRQRIAHLKRLGSADQQLLTVALQDLNDSLEEALTIQEYLRQEMEQSSFEQQKIHDERQQYHDLFDTAPYAYLTTSRAGLILEANATSALLLNTDKSFLVGLPLRVFIALEERKDFDSFVTRAEIGEQRMTFHFQPRDKATFEAAVTVRSLCHGEVFKLGWAIQEASTSMRKMEEAALAIEKERCFETWLLGHRLSEVQAYTNADAEQVLNWVREWERGVQQRWDPIIFGLSKKLP